tara:strand:- start:912 stop:1703 length:792 start_codon:yes stop_codon:yes gene_type:complete
MSSLKGKFKAIRTTKQHEFTRKELEILSSCGKTHMQPGNYSNMLVFWPLYLKEHTKNVEVLNMVLVWTPKSRFLRFDDRISPKSLMYAEKPYCRLINTKKRFLYIILAINNPNGKSSHANGLLYDTKKQTLEHFEPHGNGVQLKYTNLSLATINKIKAYLTTTLGIPIKQFRKLTTTCPRVGWQVRHGPKRISDSLFDEQWSIGGYCAAWSMYFILLRAKNVTLSVLALQMRAFENYEETSDYIHNFYYDFLRFKLKVLKRMK